MPEVRVPSYDRFVLIHNPSGTRLAEACEQELAASKLGKPVMRFMSAAGGHLPNAEQLAARLRPGDAIGGVFGDGTTRDILGALMQPEVVRDFGCVPFASLAGGNARDIGRATQRRRHAAPSTIFARSVAVDAYAMNVAITREGETANYHAISYVGIGKTAKATKQINSPSYRLGIPVIRDIRIGLGSIVSPHAFGATMPGNTERRLGDLTFAKGPRMAKLGRFPVQYWDKEIRVTPISPGMAAAGMAAAGLLTGRAAGENYSQPYTFDVLDPTDIHLDGDPPLAVLPGNSVGISLHDQPYRLLTTRLAA